MVAGRIRIYGEALSQNSTIVGLSGQVADTPKRAGEAWEEFFEQENLSIAPVETRQSRIIGAAYHEVKPPMNEEQIRRFAALCLRYADAGHNGVYVIDNRMHMPTRPLETAGIILGEQ